MPINTGYWIILFEEKKNYISHITFWNNMASRLQHWIWLKRTFFLCVQIAFPWTYLLFGWQEAEYERVQKKERTRGTQAWINSTHDVSQSWIQASTGLQVSLFWYVMELEYNIVFILQATHDQSKWQSHDSSRRTSGYQFCGIIDRA